MTRLSFKRHRFPPQIIKHAIWLYVRFTLSFRDVEEMLAERGIDLSNETVRRWFLKFGGRIARPPKAAFVTRLQPGPLPSQTARQLTSLTDNCLGGSFLHW